MTALFRVLKPAFVLVIACHAMLFFSCGGPSDGKEQRYVLVDGDTISFEQLAELRPGVELDSITRRALAFQIAMAGRTPEPDSVIAAAVIADFSEQLSLRTGAEWNERAARSLFEASRAAAHLSDTAIQADSVREALRTVGKASGTTVVSSDDALIAALSKEEALARLDALVRSLFALDAEASRLAAEFARAPASGAADSASLARMKNAVRGLVYDSAAQAKKSRTKTARTGSRKVDNSALALKYRDHQSILQSIGKHTANLEALYRKELKLQQDMQGIIYVRFRVGPSGNVLSAKIQSSDIDEKAFLEPFLSYVQSIRFEPIPEKVGPMSFDFPFEFKPES